MKLNIIDFDPASISCAYTEGHTFIIDFPCQYFYGDAEYGQVKCHCQIHIEDFQVIVNKIHLHKEIDEFEVQSQQESRHCFLPEGYSVNGPVSYCAKLNGILVIEVKGKSLKLIVLSKTNRA